MLSSVILGNLFSLGAMFTDSISSNQKSSEKMLTFQCFSQMFYGASSLVLKGYSAVVQSALALVRNILAIRKIHSDAAEWIILILGIVLGIAFNNLGLLGYLPVVANGLYTFSIFRISHNQTALRWAFLIYLVLYVIFDLFILNYVGAVATAIAIVSTAVSIIRNR